VQSAEQHRYGRSEKLAKLAASFIQGKIRGMHVHNRRPAWLLVTPVPPLLLLLLLVITPRQSAAYSNNPFQGQGVAPPGSVKIYLTILLERVLEVNQVNYGFQAITYFYFSWHDPRAKAAIAEYSAAQNDPGAKHVTHE
jgi:hypothetical protein